MKGQVTNQLSYGSIFFKGILKFDRKTSEQGNETAQLNRTWVEILLLLKSKFSKVYIL